MSNDKDGFDKRMEVEDNLKRAAWKLQGIAGLMRVDSIGDSIALETDAANGLSILLEDIAQTIISNASKIEEVKG